MKIIYHPTAIVTLSILIVVTTALFVLPGFGHKKFKAERINTARNITALRLNFPLR